MEKHEDLLDRPTRQTPLGQHPLAEPIDALGVDRVQERVIAELGDEVAVDSVAVVPDRRRPAVLLPRDVCEPRIARLAKGVVPVAPVPRVSGRTHRGIEQLA